MAAIRWPETVAGQVLLQEKERQLFRFAIENIASELLAGYEKVMFRDQGGLTILFVWGQPERGDIRRN